MKNPNDPDKGVYPRLRFPEFDGDWMEKKLGEVAEKINSGKTPLGGESVYSTKGVLFIRSQNINNDRLELENSVFISEEINKEMKNSIVHSNDILLNITGASLGRSCVVPQNFTVGNVNQHVCIIRVNEESISKFIQPFFSSNKGQNIFQSLQTGSGREGLNFESIKGIQLYLPTLPEQQKIASFLSLIDDRISTQNKIIKQLETLSTELSEKLFTRKLRFPEFKDEWLKHNVADLLEFFPTNSLSWIQLEYNTDTLYNLHYGLIHQTTLNWLDMEVCNLPCIKSEFTPKNYALCKDGDIAFADASEDTNDVAKAIEFTNCKEKKIVCGLHTIHGRDKLNLTVNGFKGYAFNSKSFRQQIRQLAQGTKVFSISSRTFRECYIDIPSKEEQLKISDLLSSINIKLGTERHILQQFEVQKKYFLHKMFI